MRACPACVADSSRAAGEAKGFRASSLRGVPDAVHRPVAASEAKDYEQYYPEENLTVPSFVERRLEEIVSTARSPADDR
jgi:hypothetical protein